MRAFLGIDEGTSAVKAQLFDADMRPLADCRRQKRTSHPGEGLVEQDPLEVLDAVVGVVADLLKQVPDAEIAGCGLDHQGESVLAWDPETGRPLSAIITWQDKRSQPLLDALTADERTTVVERSGLPLDPYFSAGKIAWLIQNGLSSDARVGTVDSWLTSRLGAGFATDRSTASRTQLAELGSDRWDPTLCELFGVDRKQLPVLRDSVGDLGRLHHPSWGRELALTAQVVDQQAALAGSGSVSPGQVKATFGTGVFVLAFLGPAALEGVKQAGLLPTVAWSIDGVVHYALDGGVFAAGALLEWLSGDLGLFESPRALTELAERAADSSGIRVLPALSGLGAPWWEPTARGVIAGLTPASSKEQIARASVEGIVHRVCDVLDAVRAIVPLDELRVDGGLTQSDFIVQLQADLSQLPVQRSATDATSLGVAALAAVGCGDFSSVAEVAGRFPRGEVFTPRAVPPGERARWLEFVRAASRL